MYDEEIIEIIKERLAKSRKITTNQHATIEDILDSNRQMIDKRRN